MTRPTIDEIFILYGCLTESEVRQRAYLTYSTFLIIKMAALVYRAGGEVDWFSRKTGICFNARWGGRVLDFKKTYPVTGDCGVYHSSKEKWIGEYGDNRMKFLDDCLYALEKYLKL